MTRFLKFYKKDKTFIKMINQSINGFELVIFEEKMNDILKIIDDCKKSGEKLDVVWQMKFKEQNFVHYKNCIFSEPVFDKFVLNEKIPTFRRRHFSSGVLKNTKNGVKIKVSCSNADYYSESSEYKNRKIKKSFNLKYKDSILLNRMLKISEIDYKNE